MEALYKVESIVTEDSITLYWERPRDIHGSHRYEIELNGKALGNTEKTHYELEGLQADTAYTIAIRLVQQEEDGAEGHIAFRQAIDACGEGNSLCGIEIKGTKKRGGYVRNVSVRHCQAARVLFHSVTYNDDGVGAQEPPIFEKCTFEHMHILGEYYGHEREWIACDAIELCGFDTPGHELRDILFDHITIGSTREKRRQQLSLQCCENLTLRNIRCF